MPHQVAPPGERLEDTEGGTGIVPSPAIFDFLQQLLGAQPGGALANASPAGGGGLPSPASIGIGRPPAVPRGIQSGVPSDLAAPPPKPTPPTTTPPVNSGLDTVGQQVPFPAVDSSLDTVGQQVPLPTASARTTPTSGIGRAAAGTVGSGAAPGAGGNNALIEAILQMLSGGGGRPNVNPIGRAAAATR